MVFFFFFGGWGEGVVSFHPFKIQESGIRIDGSESELGRVRGVLRLRLRLRFRVRGIKSKTKTKTKLYHKSYISQYQYQYQYHLRDLDLRSSTYHSGIR